VEDDSRDDYVYRAGGDIFINTIHRSDEAFMVYLGIDCNGEKKSLRFWQRATENAEES
jgi:hypothetical protein